MDTHISKMHEINLYYDTLVRLQTVDKRQHIGRADTIPVTSISQYVIKFV